MGLAQDQRLLEQANRIERVLLLDGLWTSTIEAGVADEDRLTLIDIGREIGALVRDVAGSLAEFRAVVEADPQGFGRRMEHALQIADERQPWREANSPRAQIRSEEWAGLMIDAATVFEADSQAEVDELDRKLRLIEGGQEVPGDLSVKLTVASLLLTAGLLCVAPAATLLGLAVAANVGNAFTVAGIAVGTAVEVLRVLRPG